MRLLFPHADFTASRPWERAGRGRCGEKPGKSPPPRCVHKTGRENQTMAKPIHVKSGEFETRVLQAQGPVVVDFWAEWCGPCRLMAPVIDQLAEEYDGRIQFIEVDVDENPDVAMTYGVEGIPTLISSTTVKWSTGSSAIFQSQCSPSSWRRLCRWRPSPEIAHPRRTGEGKMPFHL